MRRGNTTLLQRWRRFTRFAPIAVTILVLWEFAARVRTNLGPRQVASGVALTLLLFGLRRWPFQVAALSLAPIAWIVSQPSVPGSVALASPLTICAFLVAGKPRFVGYGYAVACACIGAFVNPSTAIVNDLIEWAFVFTGAALVGEAGRYLRRSVGSIEEGYRERERHQRHLIARELHDTTAYDLTTIIMTLERQRIRGIPDPEMAQEVDYMVLVGRQSVSNLRGILHLLREDSQPSGGFDTDDWPLRSRAALDTVLAEAEATLRQAGLTPTVTHIAGETPISLSVRTVIMRTTRECVANMAKYALPGSDCLIMLEEGTHEVELLFVNQVPGSARRDAALTSQLGLVGIRERVEMVGGTFTARRSGNQWIAHTSIPHSDTLGVLTSPPGRNRPKDVA